MMHTQAVLLTVLSKRLAPLEKADNPLEEIYETCRHSLTNYDLKGPVNYADEATHISDCLEILLKLLRNEPVKVDFDR